jgi:hypothetical protein
LRLACLLRLFAFWLARCWRLFASGLCALLLRRFAPCHSLLLLLLVSLLYSLVLLLLLTLFGLLPSGVIRSLLLHLPGSAALILLDSLPFLLLPLIYPCCSRWFAARRFIARVHRRWRSPRCVFSG